MLAGLQPERSESVPEIVEADVREVGTLEERLEVPRGEVVAVHRATAQRRKDEVLVTGLGLPGGVPELGVAKPLFQVPEAVGFQCRDGLGKKVNGTALTGLCGIAQVGFATYQGDGAAAPYLSSSLISCRSS